MGVLLQNDTGVVGLKACRAEVMVKVVPLLVGGFHYVVVVVGQVDVLATLATDFVTHFRFLS